MKNKHLPVVDAPPRKVAADLASRPPSNGKNGEANKLSAEDRPAHDWFRFVLSYPPHLVKDYVERFGIGPKHCVLDPFCGTGTTVVECKKLGVPSLGTEANPMAHFAAEVKVDWSVDASDLLLHAAEIAAETTRQLEQDGIPDIPPSGDVDLFTHLSPARKKRISELRTLSPDLMDLLLANSISPVPLHKTLVLLDQLRAAKANPFARHEQLALAKAIVFSISNLHFGPEVGVGKPKHDAAVVHEWLTGVRQMAADVESLRGRNDTPARIFHCDSRQISQVIPARSVDAVITSPPYPNEKDYTRTTRLESVLLGFIKSKAELRALKKGLVRSNTRGVYKEDDDDQWVAKHGKIQQIARDIEARRIEMGKTSGFERLYHRVTKLYFGGMAKHLADMRPILKPGAHLAYVVGDQASYLRVMIRTGQLLGEIAEELGYELVNIDLFRTRLATATKEQLREEVVILRWPG